MIFYSSVAIIMGLLFLIVGIANVATKKALLENNKLAASKQYRHINGLVMIATGAVLFIAGVLSFIYSYDLLFASLFSVTIVLFLAVDYICRKKLATN